MCGTADGKLVGLVNQVSVGDDDDNDDIDDKK